jgi:hypothetical protein
MLAALRAELMLALIGTNIASQSRAGVPFEIVTLKVLGPWSPIRSVI